MQRALHVLLRIVFAALAAALLFFLLRWVWRLWVANWQAITFWTYVAIALIVGVSGIITRRLALRGDPEGNADRATFQTLHAMQETRSIGAMTQAFGNLLSNISLALAWPAVVVSGFRLDRRLNRAGRRGSPIAQAAFGTLYPPETTMALACLVSAITPLALHKIVNLPPNAGATFLLVLYVACCLRLLSYSIGRPLPTVLRRSPRSPYVRFILISVTWGIFLVCLLTALTYGPGLVGAEGIADVGQDFLTLRRIRAVFESEPLRASDYYVIVAALLYDMAIVRTLLNFKEFGRTEEDNRVIAACFGRIGAFDDGLLWLEKCGSQTSDTGLTVRIGLLLGVNRIDHARTDAEHLLQLRKTAGSASDDANSVEELIHDIGITVPLPAHTSHRVLGILLNSNAPAATMVCALQIALVCGKLPADALTQYKSEPFPTLVRVRAATLLREHELAGQLLDGYVPETALDDFTARCLRILAIITPTSSVEEDRKQLGAWLDANLDHLLELAKQIPSNLRIKAFPSWSFVEGFVAGYLPARREEARHFSRRMLETITNPSERRGLEFQHAQLLVFLDAEFKKFTHSSE